MLTERVPVAPISIRRSSLNPVNDAHDALLAKLDFEMVRLDLTQRSMERETRTNILFLVFC